MSEEDNNKKGKEIASSHIDNTNLEEIEEMGDIVSEDISDLNENDPEKIISDLQAKLVRLEKMNKDLRSRNEELKKHNIEKNTTMMKMSLVGLRRKFTSQGDFNQVQNDSVKLAQIIKEKDDLQ